jgi:hypothetical protein
MHWPKYIIKKLIIFFVCGGGILKLVLAGPNSTTLIYNTSVVKIYDTTT